MRFLNTLMLCFFMMLASFVIFLGLRPEIMYVLIPALGAYAEFLLG